MGVPKPLEEKVIAEPAKIIPSNEDMEVIGVCNPGATIYNKNGKDFIYLLLRVIEKPKVEFEGHVASPFAIPNETGKYRVRWDWERIDKDAKITGPYSIQMIEQEYRSKPTTISHLRLAKSLDGINFEIDKEPTFFPVKTYEEFGTEDARITKFYEPFKVDGKDYNYLITYVAFSEEEDICTAFAVTNDFESFIRIPKDNPNIIFSAPSKDVVVFPKKFVNPRTEREEFLALTRPVGSGHMVPSILLAYSNDLLQWGDYQHLIKGDEKGHVGAGPTPIELDEGWLIVDHQHRHLIDGTKEYIGRTFLTDKKNPKKILRKSNEILKPHLDTRVKPVVKNVTFPSGAVLRDDKLYIYAGEEDVVTAVHIFKLEDIMDFLEPV